ncbi:unnamed protein product [Rotaria magnacalcarata]|uniref:Uncharacterized protein n=2 Tax=Rotaria magnacalcarata TaxID=392030 RepID=A0A817A9Z4_9BILA|nr:unnamed protein product [Rotaria magnacalcarata]
MKILCDNTHATHQLPQSHKLILDSQILPSKLNIKLKTHSLTCLNVPLETFSDFKQSSGVNRNDKQRTMAGSVDLISEMQQQLNNENLSSFSSSKPLINSVSLDKQFPSSGQPCQQIIKHRFRLSNSFLTHSSINDSVARLRRSRHLHNLHQSSLQTIDKVPKRKNSYLRSYNGPIPKFTFRDLPSYSRQTSSNRRFEPPSDFQMSPYTSLPELQSFVKQKSSDNKTIINDKYNPLPSSKSSSWKKSGSWSWKSYDALEIQSNIINKQTQFQLDDERHSNLPVIIESPVQQRSSLQAINLNCSSTKLTDIHRSKASFYNDFIQQKQHRFQKKKINFPHSPSNYELQQDRLSYPWRTRYPSTPLLASASRNKFCNNKFDYHSYDLDITPMVTYDDDDDTDTVSTHSSFRSCLDSINGFSENNITDISSSLSSSSLISSLKSCLHEVAPICDLTPELTNETAKRKKLSIRHLCIIQ